MTDTINLMVVIGIDASEPAEDLLRFFSELSMAKRCDITLMKVTPPLPTYAVADPVWIPDASEIIDAQNAAGERLLNSLKEQYVGVFHSMRSVIRQGSPGREIQSLANEMSADLVLLASRGHSAIGRLLLGSTSDYVANHASQSCWVHRPAGSDVEHSTVALQRVLIAVSNAASDERLVNWIDRLNLPVGSMVQLVHVMETHAEYDLDLLKRVSAYVEEVRSVAWKIMEQSRLKIESDSVRVETSLLESPHVGQAILEHADKHECDLIIVGDQDETLAERVLLGSVSHYVVRHASQSVLIAR